MRKIKIDVFNVNLRVYVNDEKELFQKDTNAAIMDGYYGLNCGNNIWIGEEKGITTEQIVLHELTHFLDWLFESHLEIKGVTLWDTTELRAYTMQWLFGKVMEVL